MAMDCWLAVSNFFFRFSKFPIFLESTVSSDFLSMSLTSEVGYSRNLPALLCFHDSAMILTACFNIQAMKCHKYKVAKSAHKAFY